MFKRVLIANRGEIAVRVIRTLREMDIRSIAVFSDADREALFVKHADEAYYLGASPAAESYLNIGAILACARQSGADAVHPGYGFLAENADFAEAVIGAGLTFIGPSPGAMRLMGDKIAARRAVSPLGVPVVPGTDAPVSDVRQALDFAEAAGYPVAVKAAGGGGGRGIRIVHTPENMPAALEGAEREASAYFKNPEVYLEKYFHDPRHIEIQVLGDQSGKIVHLGERDCSTQRRHQKLIEETPSPAVDRELRSRIGDAAILAARSARYTSAGTVEFLLSRESEFFFLEMNTRIQVEHGITERVTGVDLIREMILIAAGEGMTVPESILEPNGHAIEVRVNAEDPLSDFRPTPGPITRYREPGGIGVRMDSGVYQGYTVPANYDSLLAKVIAWAPDREQSCRRMMRALREYEIEGPATTIPFSTAVLSSPAFVGGEVGTTFVESNIEELRSNLAPPATTQATGEQSTGEQRIFDIEVNRKLFTVRVAERHVQSHSQNQRPRRARRTESASIVSPMHGNVIAIRKAMGESVAEGEVVFVIEAMKMQNEVTAHRPGVVKTIDTTVGETVEAEQALATIE